MLLSSEKPVPGRGWGWVAREYAVAQLTTPALRVCPHSQVQRLDGVRSKEDMKENEHEEHPKAAPIPVTVVAGFLGAGKTTLINHILHGGHGRRIAVVVNDFGSINIDAELVERRGEGMVSLANGCICCVVRSDLVQRGAQTGRRPEAAGSHRDRVERRGRPGQCRQSLHGA